MPQRVEEAFRARVAILTPLRDRCRGRASDICGLPGRPGRHRRSDQRKPNRKKSRQASRPRSSIRPCWLSRSPVGYAIGITSDSSPSSLASICGRQPADAHHLRFAQSPALGRKVSDEFTVPLCRGHHREVHRCGDEPVWWLKVRINPMVKARALWLKTHPLPARTRA